MTTEQHVKHETIHDEIEAEISHMTGVSRSRLAGMGWKIVAILVLAGIGVWAAWPSPNTGPIHPASATVK